MNSNDLQNLSEAYGQVHQLDEFLFGPSKVTPKGGQLSGSKAPVEVDKKYIAQKQGQLVNVQYDKGGNRKVSPMSNIERGTAALKLRQSGGGASSPSMNQYQTQSFEPEGEFIEQLSTYVQARHGSTPATATDHSISSALDKALENLPTGGKKFHSASHETGKTGITGSGYIQYSGSLNPNPAPKPAPAPAPAPKPPTGTPKPTKPGTTPVPTPLTPPAGGTKIRDERTTNQFGTSEIRTVNGAKQFSRFTPTTNVIQRNSYEPEGEFIEQFTYYQVLSYLIDEGYASSEQAADKIILNMSEAWFENIMERRRS